MEITLKFYKVEDKMPERWQKSNSSSELLIKLQGFDDLKYGTYNFQEKKWEDGSDWHDFYGCGELKNVEMWALIPSVGIESNSEPEAKLDIPHVGPNAFVAEDEFDRMMVVFAEDIDEAEKKLRDKGHTTCLIVSPDITLH